MLSSFAALDFETANSYPSSVCSVGVVIVRSGEFVERFYSLIQPEPNYYRLVLPEGSRIVGERYGRCAGIPVCLGKDCTTHRGLAAGCS